MASVSGMRPTRGEAPYAASKAAVIALTQSAALEYGPTIRVNCVSPGLIETTLTAPLMGDEKVRAGFDRKTPLGRVGTADDVASVIAFLCSDMAAYVTGINVPVDGGSLLPSAQVDGVLSAILALYD
jgi:NAD(P)-dependent dehydrogenase (short-subunit alcohol dehydrogenase family)